jgi:hypothetical protein
MPLWSRWRPMRRWKQAIVRVFRIVRSPLVPLRLKLLFLLPALLYWVLPDAMPGLPFDDAAVTLLLLRWFASYTKKKYPQLQTWKDK